MNQDVLLNKLSGLEDEIARLKGLATGTSVPARRPKKKIDAPNPHSVEGFKEACRHKVRPPLTDRQRARLNQPAFVPPARPVPAVDYSMAAVHERRKARAAEIAALILDEKRNAKVAESITKCAVDGRVVVVLTDAATHADILCGAIHRRNRSLKTMIVDDDHLVIESDADVLIMDSTTLSHADFSARQIWTIFIAAPLRHGLQLTSTLSKLLLPIPGQRVPLLTGPADSGLEGVRNSVMCQQRDHYELRKFKHLWPHYKR